MSNESQEHAQSGFTLLELIVALTIVGLMFGFFATAWVTVSTVDDRLRDYSDENHDQNAARAVLTGIAEAALPWIDRAGGERTLRFSGRADSVVFITAKRDYEAGPAYEVWRLQVEQRDRGYRILAERAPYFQDTETETALRNAEPRELLAYDTEPRFSFLGKEEGTVRWVRDWIEEQDLPLAIMLASQETEEPPLIVELKHRFAAVCAGPLAAEFDECV